MSKASVHVWCIIIVLNRNGPKHDFLWMLNPLSVVGASLSYRNYATKNASYLQAITDVAYSFWVSIPVKYKKIG